MLVKSVAVVIAQPGGRPEVLVNGRGHVADHWREFSQRFKPPCAPVHPGHDCPFEVEEEVEAAWDAAHAQALAEYQPALAFWQMRLEVATGAYPGTSLETAFVRWLVQEHGFEHLSAGFVYLHQEPTP